LSYWIRVHGERKPFDFFRAAVDRQTGQVTVVTSEPIDILLEADLCDDEGRGLDP
jgi:hypothetical protein